MKNKAYIFVASSIFTITSFDHGRKFKISKILNFGNFNLKTFLSTVPRRYFFCGSFMFLFCLVFAMSVRVCLYVLCGHLLGKG